jgi:hypothetical protein
MGGGAMQAAALAAFLAATIVGCTSPATAPPATPAPTAPQPPSQAPPTTAPPAAADIARPARLVPLAGQAPGQSSSTGTAPAFSVGGSGASTQCLADVEAFAERHSGNRVMLGQAAFATSDELVLTRMPHRGPDGGRLDGRAPAPAPLVLRLLATPAGCVVRVTDGAAQDAGRAAPPREMRLPDCGCRPVRETEE